jgi:hypothetical protein
VLGAFALTGETPFRNIPSVWKQGSCPKKYNKFRLKRE